MERMSRQYAARSSAAAAAVGERWLPPVFCPKPRRFAPLAGGGHTTSFHAELCDSKGSDPLEMFLSKGEEQSLMVTSPPFFCGSPPVRTSNPVIHDSRFGEDCLQVPVFPSGQFSPSPVAPLNPTPMSPRTGCVRAVKFGFQPPAVRVEGFDCRLDRDRRSAGRHSITAVA